MSKLYKEQNFILIEADDLLEKAMDFKTAGYRLGQACCTNVEGGFELLYSFDKDHELTNLKIEISMDKEMMSISGVYWPAFIYENEMHDLFGITFKHNVLDFGGHFYRVAEPTPWRPKEAAAAPETES